MDHETLVAALAQLWTTMSDMVDTGKKYVHLKQESEFMLGAVIEALLLSEDTTANDISAAIRAACEFSGLAEDNQVVRIVKRELGQIEEQRRIAAMRDNAAMN